MSKIRFGNRFFFEFKNTYVQVFDSRNSLTLDLVRNFTNFDKNLVKLLSTVNCVSEFRMRKTWKLKVFNSRKFWYVCTRPGSVLSSHFTSLDCFVATATLSKQKILTRRIPQYYYQPRSSLVLEIKATKVDFSTTYLCIIGWTWHFKGKKDYTIAKFIWQNLRMVPQSIEKGLVQVKLLLLTFLSSQKWSSLAFSLICTMYCNA